MLTFQLLQYSWQTETVAPTGRLKASSLVARYFYLTFQHEFKSILLRNLFYEIIIMSN